MSIALAQIRSLLFAPGSDARKLDRALESAADAVVADLEDSVVADEKKGARELVVERLGRAPDAPGKMVRINGADTPYFADDLTALRDLDLAAIVIPKATPDAVEELGAEGPPIIAIIETAQGVRLAYETASAPRVAALVLGGADLGAELWLEPRADSQEILYARSKLVVDSAAAGIRGPFDVVHLNVRDNSRLEGEARLARSLGLRGKVCIHPDQVPIVNAVFAPSEEELSWATDVLDAYREAARDGRGALVVRGELIDMALVQRAERIVTHATGGAHGD